MPRAVGAAQPLLSGAGVGVAAERAHVDGHGADALGAVEQHRHVELGRARRARASRSPSRRASRRRGACAGRRASASSASGTSRTSTPRSSRAAPARRAARGAPRRWSGSHRRARAARPPITCAMPSVVQVVSATSAASHAERGGVGGAQLGVQLAAALEVRGGAPLAELALELAFGGGDRARGQRPVGARVQVGEVSRTGNSARSPGRLTNRENTRMASAAEQQPLWAPPPEQRETVEMARFMGLRPRAAGVRSRATTSCGAGRWTSSRSSGRASGSSAACARQSRTSGCWTRTRCRARAGSTARELNYAENLLRRDGEGRAEEVAVLHAPSCAS